jgi:hypothetical protein
MLIGVISILISAVLFLSLFYNNDFMCKDEEQKYKEIAGKIKSQRTQDEQDFIDKTWHIYWSRKVSKHSFVIGVLLLMVAILFNKFN